MPIITPDTSQVKSIAPLDPGVYPAKIVAVEFKTSSKGNPMIVPSFEITHDGTTRKRDAYLVITGEGAYGFDSLLRAAGFSDYADALKSGSKEPFDTDNLIGVDVNVQVEQEAYNGQMRDKVAGFLPA